MLQSMAIQNNSILKGKKSNTCSRLIFTIFIPFSELILRLPWITLDQPATRTHVLFSPLWMHTPTTITKTHVSAFTTDHDHSKCFTRTFQLSHSTYMWCNLFVSAAESLLGNERIVAYTTGTTVTSDDVCSYVPSAAEYNVMVQSGIIRLSSLTAHFSFQDLKKNNSPEVTFSCKIIMVLKQDKNWTPKLTSGRWCLPTSITCIMTVCRTNAVLGPPKACWPSVRTDRRSRSTTPNVAT